MHLVCAAMKLLLSALLCFLVHLSFGQKLSVAAMEKLLFASPAVADSLLQKTNFKLADKEKGKGYHNYYYTSSQKTDTTIMLRTLSFMDLYKGKDTSRLILYRTYSKSDQEEFIKQLLSSGYLLTKRESNNFTYKKEALIITSKISEKPFARGKTVTAYEFETGR